LEAITKRDGAAAKNKNTFPQLEGLIPSLGRKSLEFIFLFAECNTAQFITLFPVFVNQESAEQVIRKYYWKNDAHWNEEGHRLVADALLEDNGGIQIPKKEKN
jgi:hypothetical protein